MSVTLCKTLCNNHNQIIYNLKEMRKLTKDKELRELITDTLNIVKYCKKQGQKMENRLTLYKEGIEKLGFERKK